MHLSNIDYNTLLKIIKTFIIIIKYIPKNIFLNILLNILSNIFLGIF